LFIKKEVFEGFDEVFDGIFFAVLGRLFATRNARLEQKLINFIGMLNLIVQVFQILYFNFIILISQTFV
jgi:hypothetical protein